MQELRLVAVSEDGSYLVLASAGRGTRFMLPVDDRLRAAVRGQFSRLGQYEIEVENPLRPKEIQARIRSGETAEAIAETSGIPIDRVRWFESPVLQEREYMSQQAQHASVRRQGDSAPGPTLGDLVTERVGAHQLETGEATWDSWKREDNTWHLKLVFYISGEERVAHWIYEPRRRCVTPADEEAARFSTPQPEEPLELGMASANVTPFVPRRSGTEQATQRNTPAASPPVEEPPAATETAPPASAARNETEPEHARPFPKEEDQPSTDDAVPEVSETARTTSSAGETQVPERPEPSVQRESTEPPPPDRGDEGQEGSPESSLPAAAGGAAQDTGQTEKRKGRGRRSSVPSWDEIMFGAKKSE
ncbi:septation protein SepH [Haloactinospora alba]|nr:septation protein SepH [Haloactinospora alba]